MGREMGGKFKGEGIYVYLWLIHVEVELKTPKFCKAIIIKFKKELPYDPAISLSDIYREKTILRRDTCTPMFIAALFTIARMWEQPKCPLTDEWIKKIGPRTGRRCMYTYG